MAPLVEWVVPLLGRSKMLDHRPPPCSGQVYQAQHISINASVPSWSNTACFSLHYLGACHA